MSFGLRWDHVAAVALLLVAVSCSDPSPLDTTLPPNEPTTRATTTSTTTTVVDPPPSTTATTTPPTSTTVGWERPEPCPGPCDPAIEVLFTLPVGDDGVGYAGIGQDEVVPWGPSSIGIDETGNVWIIDQVHNRLLAYTPSGAPVTTIDLADYEVAAGFDIATGPGGMLLLDIYVAAKRYRILRLDIDGALVSAHDLPEGLHLENGLSGLAVGPSGETWVELEGGARVAELALSGGDVEFAIDHGYPYPWGRYGTAADTTFAFDAGDVRVDVTTSAPLGGLTLLSVNPDGSFSLVLDEVYLDNDAFRVERSIHLFGEDGTHLGAASFPFDDQVVQVEHPLAVGPDGRCYALLTREDHVEIVVLPFGSTT